MRKTHMLAAATALALLCLAPMPHIIRSAHAECQTGDRIDGSRASDAQKKIEAAGYAKVNGLKKSCDNFWHGKAEKDGREVRVVLSPQGQILPEGD
jgi:hypothetical protein